MDDDFEDAGPARPSGLLGKPMPSFKEALMKAGKENPDGFKVVLTSSASEEVKFNLIEEPAFGADSDTRTRAEKMLAESIQLRTEIDIFVDEYHEKLDGELWDAMEMENKYLRQDIELLSGDHLTESGLDIVARRNSCTRIWFDEQKADTLEYLEATK